MKSNEKINLCVNARFDVCGKIIPLSIVWPDGRSFEIDQILDVRRAASLKAGGIGTRYTCKIRNKIVNIFNDEKYWYMER